MSFYAHCSKILGENEIFLRKFSYDKKKNFFLVPDEFKSLNLHPLIKHSKSCNLSKLYDAPEGYRNVALPLFDKNKRSKESLKYIDKDGDFVINDVKCIAETDDGVQSNKKLQKQYSFDTDSEDDVRDNCKKLCLAIGDKNSRSNQLFSSNCSSDLLDKSSKFLIINKFRIKSYILI